MVETVLCDFILFSHSARQPRDTQPRCFPLSLSSLQPAHTHITSSLSLLPLPLLSAPATKAGTIARPLRFVVSEKEPAVIDTALKSYDREGRFPVFGSDLNNFLLYSANAGADALSPWDTIGSRGGRNFVLRKKQQPHQVTMSVGRSLPKGAEKSKPTQIDGFYCSKGEWKLESMDQQVNESQDLCSLTPKSQIQRGRKKEAGRCP